MKAKKFMAMLMAASLLAGFTTACDDDDDDNTTEDYAAAVVAKTYGTYSLANAAYFKGMFTDEEDGSIKLTKIDANYVSVNFTSNTWGEFAIDSALVLKTDTSYLITGNGTVAMAGHGGTSNYDVKLNASVNGENTVFAFSVPTVMGGTTVVVYNTQPAASLVVANSYAGTLSAEVMGTACGDTATTVKIAYASDNLVNITLPGYTYKTMAMGAVVVEGVSVSESNGVYTLTLEEDVTVVGKMGDSDINVKVSGLSGKVEDGELTLTYNETPGSMPMAISYSFATTK